MANFNGYFYKDDLLDWLLNLEDYLTLRIFIMREKLDLFCINLVIMPCVSGNEYNLIESYK